MNIPVEIARAQGHHGIKGAAYGVIHGHKGAVHGHKGAVHGIKGAVHGVKGGRPRLPLSDAEKAARRNARARDSRLRRRLASGKPLKGTEADYRAIWGKPPGEPLTAAEFAEREPFWNACKDRLPVSECIAWKIKWAAGNLTPEEYAELEPLYLEMINKNGGPVQSVLEKEGITNEHLAKESAWERSLEVHPPSWEGNLIAAQVADALGDGAEELLREERLENWGLASEPGRNDPCPCRSGRKFKKCCGRSESASPGPVGPPRLSYGGKFTLALESITCL